MFRGYIVHRVFQIFLYSYLGIDEAVAQGFKNKSKYDRDGGAVGTVTIPGDEASEIIIRLSGSGSNLSEAALYHWCLRPNKDCY